MKLTSLSTFINDRLYACAIYIYYNRFDSTITIRHSIFRVSISHIQISSFDGFDNVSANRQTVFFVKMLVKSCVVNSNFDFDDLTYICLAT